ncbi:MAG: RNA 2',3'-cyclic phosphodiesterase [Chloroflexota bacterium]|nr:RNA 2',3'-cyclic phosphodiesterase [Chloroflexota bacterium]
MSDERHGPPPAAAERSLRLFVAVELSDAWRQGAEEVARRLQAAHGNGYRWVRPELYHVTVVFLGEQPADRLGSITDAMRAAVAEASSFELRLGDLSGFGADVARALILAVADPSGGLHALRARLDRELVERRIPFDRKPLSPHVTLGRARVQRRGERRDRARPGQVAPTSRVPRPDVGPLRVDRIALVRSDLLPGGPRYEAVATVPLGGR